MPGLLRRIYGEAETSDLLSRLRLCGMRQVPQGLPLVLASRPQLHELRAPFQSTLLGLDLHGSLEEWGSEATQTSRAFGPGEGAAAGHPAGSRTPGDLEAARRGPKGGAPAATGGSAGIPAREESLRTIPGAAP